MDEYLGAVKQRRDDLFLKLVKKITKPDYKMHFMKIEMVDEQCSITIKV